MTTSKMRQNVAAKLSQQQGEKVEEWRLLDDQIKKLTAERDAIKNELTIHIQSVGGEVGQYRSHTLVRFQETRRRIIDSKRLRAENPQIADEYTKESVSQSLHYV